MNAADQGALDEPVPLRAALPHVELDGEIVVYSPERESVSLLSPVAATVWSCMDGVGTLRELVNELAESFGADVDRVAGDVLDLVASFEEEGLLTVPEGAAGHG